MKTEADKAKGSYEQIKKDVKARKVELQRAAKKIELALKSNRGRDAQNH